MKLIILLFLLLVQVSVFSEEVRVKNTDVSWSEQLFKEFASPVTTDAKYITGGAFLSAGMVYINKEQRRYNKRETFRDARPLGNLGFVGETLGWGYLNALYILSHFGYGYFGESKENIRASEHMFKASTYTLFVTGFLKTFIKEKRPGYPEDRASFPSGHSSMSFAFASVVASRHGWVYGSLAYGAATYISVSRINDDWHYLHDVLVGMGIGAGYGWGLGYLYKEKLPYQFAVIPQYKGIAGSFTYSF